MILVRGGHKIPPRSGACRFRKARLLKILHVGAVRDQRLRKWTDRIGAPWLAKCCSPPSPSSSAAVDMTSEVVASTNWNSSDSGPHVLLVSPELKPGLHDRSARVQGFCLFKPPASPRMIRWGGHVGSACRKCLTAWVPTLRRWGRAYGRSSPP